MSPSLSRFEIRRNLLGEVYVVDSLGGVWIPSDIAQDRIQQSNNPEAEVLSLCLTQPTEGKWIQ